jgi:hypothetical protein
MFAHLMAMSRLLGVEFVIAVFATERRCWNENKCQKFLYYKIKRFLAKENNTKTGNTGRERWDTLEPVKLVNAHQFFSHPFPLCTIFCKTRKVCSPLASLSTTNTPACTQSTENTGYETPPCGYP